MKNRSSPKLGEFGHNYPGCFVYFKQIKKDQNSRRVLVSELKNIEANSTWASPGISELATDQRGVKLIFGNRDGIRSFLHPMAVSRII